MAALAKRSDYIAVLLIVAAMLGLSMTNIAERLSVLSTDLLYWGHDYLWQETAKESQVAVIAIDEQTYQSKAFAGKPKVLWTPEIAQVQEAVLDAGALVFGYDVVFPTSVSDYLPSYERPFLAALMKAAKNEQVILGKVQHSQNPVSPHFTQAFMVGGQKNIRSLNAVADIDDVIRRIPLFFQKENGELETSMSLELASRAVKQKPMIGSEGFVSLGSYQIPDSNNLTAILNFRESAMVPTYSLADIYHCAQNGDLEFLRRHFANKVVLFGAVLDVEDRKLTSRRLMTKTALQHQMETCVLQSDAAVETSRRDSIPGVYIHATAINNLIDRTFFDRLSSSQSKLLVVIVSVFACFLAVSLSPYYGLSALLLSLGTFWGFGIWLFDTGFLIPVLTVSLMMFISYVLMTIYRFKVSDYQKNRIRKLFNLYLHKGLIDQMLESEQMPDLGGEAREITVWFSDLKDFTKLSEGMSSKELVAVMNLYFSTVTEIIEQHGGFVDKYIGDAVLAVFGAPHQDEYHSGHAVAAALMVREKLKTMNAQGSFGDSKIHCRTGINTGLAVVGNVGSSKRFNYTVMGDTVNLASRLEGVNKVVKSDILISKTVADQLPSSIVSRKIGNFRVKGKGEVTTVYQPLSMQSWRALPRVYEKNEEFRHLNPAEKPDYVLSPMPYVLALEISQVFENAIQFYERQDFQGMMDILSPYEKGDAVASALIEKAGTMMHSKIPEEWQAVDVMTSK